MVSTPTAAAEHYLLSLSMQVVGWTLVSSSSSYLEGLGLKSPVLALSWCAEERGAAEGSHLHT